MGTTPERSLKLQPIAGKTSDWGSELIAKLLARSGPLSPRTTTVKLGPWVQELVALRSPNAKWGRFAAEEIPSGIKLRMT
jgi:hypothetical protein